MRTARVAIALAAMAFLGALKPAGVSAQAQTASMSDSQMQAQIEAKEREGLRELETGDLTHFRELMAENGIFVDSHARSTREQVLADVGGFRLTDFSMTQVKFVRVAAETGLISYEFSDEGVAHAHAFATHTWVSSLWTRRGGRWECLFSQSSSVEPPAAGAPGRARSAPAQRTTRG